MSMFIFFYGNCMVDSIIFWEEIEGLKNEYMGWLCIYYVFSCEKLGSLLLSGCIFVDKCVMICDKLIDIVEVDDFYFCGLFLMIEGIWEVLE